MQDFQSIPGLTGRIFTGNTATAGSDNRRLRSYPSAQPQPPVKCPRCDSSNTKFCYYNNYNLSQPRHFCKSCRRYWTKGGVLRNVPVGGGCRKNSKRSSSSKSSSKSDKDRRRPSSGSGSSSDSSSLTASASASNPNPNPNPNPDPILDPVGMGPEMFPEAGSFTSFMAAAAEAGPGILGFNFPDPNPTAFRIPAPQPEQKVEETGIMDQTVPMDLPPFQGKSSGGGLTGMDWPPAAVDSSFFDLSSSVDPAVYWNQSHWGDTDPSLYLP